MVTTNLQTKYAHTETAHQFTNIDNVAEPKISSRSSSTVDTEDAKSTDSTDDTIMDRGEFFLHRSSFSDEVVGMTALGCGAHNGMNTQTTQQTVSAVDTMLVSEKTTSITSDELEVMKKMYELLSQVEDEVAHETEETVESSPQQVATEEIESTTVFVSDINAAVETEEEEVPVEALAVGGVVALAAGAASLALNGSVEAEKNIEEEVYGDIDTAEVNVEITPVDQVYTAAEDIEMTVVSEVEPEEDVPVAIDEADLESGAETVFEPAELEAIASVVVVEQVDEDVDIEEVILKSKIDTAEEIESERVDAAVVEAVVDIAEPKSDDEEGAAEEAIAVDESADIEPEQVVAEVVAGVIASVIGESVLSDVATESETVNDEIENCAAGEASVDCMSVTKQRLNKLDEAEIEHDVEVSETIESDDIVSKELVREDLIHDTVAANDEFNEDDDAVVVDKDTNVIEVIGTDEVETAEETLESEVTDIETVSVVEDTIEDSAIQEESDVIVVKENDSDLAAKEVEHFQDVQETSIAVDISEEIAAEDDHVEVDQSQVCDVEVEEPAMDSKLSSKPASDIPAIVASLAAGASVAAGAVALVQTSSTPEKVDSEKAVTLEKVNVETFESTAEIPEGEPPVDEETSIEFKEDSVDEAVDESADDESERVVPEVVTSVIDSVVEEPAVTDVVATNETIPEEIETETLETSAAVEADVDMESVVEVISPELVTLEESTETDEAEDVIRKKVNQEINTEAVREDIVAIEPEDDHVEVDQSQVVEVEVEEPSKLSSDVASDMPAIVASLAAGACVAAGTIAVVQTSSMPEKDENKTVCVSDEVDDVAAAEVCEDAASTVEVSEGVASVVKEVRMDIAQEESAEETLVAFESPDDVSEQVVAKVVADVIASVVEEPVLEEPAVDSIIPGAEPLEERSAEQAIAVDEGVEVGAEVVDDSVIGESEVVAENETAVEEVETEAPQTDASIEGDVDGVDNISTEHATDHESSQVDEEVEVAVLTSTTPYDSVGEELVGEVLVHDTNEANEGMSKQTAGVADLVTEADTLEKTLEEADVFELIGTNDAETTEEILESEGTDIETVETQETSVVEDAAVEEESEVTVVKEDVAKEAAGTVKVDVDQVVTELDVEAVQDGHETSAVVTISEEVVVGDPEDNHVEMKQPSVIETDSKSSNAVASDMPAIVVSLAAGAFVATGAIAVAHMNPTLDKVESEESAPSEEVNTATAVENFEEVTPAEALVVEDNAVEVDSIDAIVKALPVTEVVSISAVSINASADEAAKEVESPSNAAEAVEETSIETVGTGQVPVVAERGVEEDPTMAVEEVKQETEAMFVGNDVTSDMPQIVASQAIAAAAIQETDGEPEEATNIAGAPVEDKSPAGEEIVLTDTEEVVIGEMIDATVEDVLSISSADEQRDSLSLNVDETTDAVDNDSVVEELPVPEELVSEIVGSSTAKVEAIKENCEGPVTEELQPDKLVEEIVTNVTNVGETSAMEVDDEVVGSATDKPSVVVEATEAFAGEPVAEEIQEEAASVVAAGDEACAEADAEITVQEAVVDELVVVADEPVTEELAVVNTVDLVIEESAPEASVAEEVVAKELVVDQTDVEEKVHECPAVAETETVDVEATTELAEEIEEITSESVALSEEVAAEASTTEETVDETVAPESPAAPEPAVDGVTTVEEVEAPQSEETDETEAVVEEICSEEVKTDVESAIVETAANVVKDGEGGTKSGETEAEENAKEQKAPKAPNSGRWFKNLLFRKKAMPKTAKPEPIQTTDAAETAACIHVDVEDKSPVPEDVSAAIGQEGSAAIPQDTELDQEPAMETVAELQKDASQTVNDTESTEQMKTQERSSDTDSSDKTKPETALEELLTDENVAEEKKVDVVEAAVDAVGESGAESVVIDGDDVDGVEAANEGSVVEPVNEEIAVTESAESIEADSATVDSAELSEAVEPAKDDIVETKLVEVASEAEVVEESTETETVDEIDTNEATIDAANEEAAVANVDVSDDEHVSVVADEETAESSVDEHTNTEDATTDIVEVTVTQESAAVFVTEDEATKPTNNETIEVVAVEVEPVVEKPTEDAIEIEHVVQEAVEGDEVEAVSESENTGEVKTSEVEVADQAEAGVVEVTKDEGIKELPNEVVSETEAEVAVEIETTSAQDIAAAQGVEEAGDKTTEETEFVPESTEQTPEKEEISDDTEAEVTIENVEETKQTVEEEIEGTAVTAGDTTPATVEVSEEELGLVESPVSAEAAPAEIVENTVDATTNELESIEPPAATGAVPVEIVEDEIKAVKSTPVVETLEVDSTAVEITEPIPATETTPVEIAETASAAVDVPEEALVTVESESLPEPTPFEAATDVAKTEFKPVELSLTNSEATPVETVEDDSVAEEVAEDEVKPVKSSTVSETTPVETVEVSSAAVDVAEEEVKPVEPTPAVAPVETVEVGSVAVEVAEDEVKPVEPSIISETTPVETVEVSSAAVDVAEEEVKPVEPTPAVAPVETVEVSLAAVDAVEEEVKPVEPTPAVAPVETVEVSSAAVDAVEEEVKPVEPTPAVAPVETVEVGSVAVEVAEDEVKPVEPSIISETTPVETVEVSSAAVDVAEEEVKPVEPTPAVAPVETVPVKEKPNSSKTASPPAIESEEEKLPEHDQKFEVDTKPISAVSMLIGRFEKFAKRNAVEAANSRTSSRVSSRVSSPIPSPPSTFPRGNVFETVATSIEATEKIDNPVVEPHVKSIKEEAETDVVAEEEPPKVVETVDESPVSETTTEVEVTEAPAEVEKEIAETEEVAQEGDYTAELSGVDEAEAKNTLEAEVEAEAATTEAATVDEASVAEGETEVEQTTTEEAVEETPAVEVEVAETTPEPETEATELEATTDEEVVNAAHGTSEATVEVDEDPVIEESVVEGGVEAAVETSRETQTITTAYEASDASILSIDTPEDDPLRNKEVNTSAPEAAKEPELSVQAPVETDQPAVVATADFTTNETVEAYASVHGEPIPTEEPESDNQIDEDLSDAASATKETHAAHEESKELHDAGDNDIEEPELTERRMSSISPEVPTVQTDDTAVTNEATAKATVEMAPTSQATKAVADDSTVAERTPERDSTQLLPHEHLTYEILGVTRANNVIMYHIYTVNSATGERFMSIPKRYSEFKLLDEQLRALDLPATRNLPMLPKPSVASFLRGRRSKKTIEMREKAFGDFLHYVTKHQELHECAVFQQFIAN